jgi:hypothetical protein
LLAKVARLFRVAGDWHGVGVAAFGLSELLNRSDPGVRPTATGPPPALERSIVAFGSAGQLQAEANAPLVRAELARIGPASRPDPPIAYQAIAPEGTSCRGVEGRPAPVHAHMVQW